ncbi:MAG: hypothetical protein V1925_01285 [Candidatus Omnitrophota bacterium]
MDTVSISQLKTNPTKAISFAEDYPLIVKNRGVTKAYIVGKELFEKLVICLENYLDKKGIEKTDFKKGRDFEEVARELNL